MCLADAFIQSDIQLGEQDLILGADSKITLLTTGCELATFTS